MSDPTSKPHDLQCLTLRELEEHAYNIMDKQTRDYYNEGADANATLKENTTAYNKYRIRPRVLRDISELDTSTWVFGHSTKKGRGIKNEGKLGRAFKNSIPVGVASTAMQCLAHSDGEVATARACAQYGVAMGLSSFATKTLEEVAEVDGDNARALQLYLFEEREHSKVLIQRAKKAGYGAVFLTVDTPMIGRRNLEIRNQFKLPKHLKIANFNEDVDSDAAAAVMDGAQAGQGQSESTKEANAGRKRSPSQGPSQAGYHDGEKRQPPSGPVTFHTHAPNPTLSWDNTVDWLKETCGEDMEVWVKGISTAEDAQLAIEHGVDGIIVSNHGGRQLDGAMSTIDALPEIVEVVDGRIPVHIDGGIRHGTDVFKALALGADFVWIGRPALWGLAYKGQEGVEHCLRLIGDEVKLCMGLAGTKQVSDINKGYLAKVDSNGFVSRL